MNKGIIFLLISFLLTACHGNTYYHTYQPVPKTGWKRYDTLYYPIPSNIDTGYYDIEIGIRHLESYAYKDIWLEVNHNLKDSTVLQKDTFHIYLADEKGNWYGNGIGGLLQYTQSNISKIHIQVKSEQASFSIIHLMKDSLIKSIHDIGILLEHNP